MRLKLEGGIYDIDFPDCCLLPVGQLVRFERDEHHLRDVNDCRNCAWFAAECKRSTYGTTKLATQRVS